MGSRIETRLAVPGTFWVARRALLLLAAFNLIVNVSFSADDLTARQTQIANLTLSEQQQLLRNQERFNELPVEEQQRMRNLHQQLQSDPNSGRLKGVLDRYHEWLKTLTPEQRAELAELPAEKRIDEIRNLMARQREEQNRRRPRYGGGEPLPPEDIKVIFGWFGDKVWENREKLLASIPQPRRGQVEQFDEKAQRRALMFHALHRGKSEPLPIEPAEYEELAKKLSQPTQAKLAAATTPQQKKRLAKEWLAQAVMSKMEAFSMRRSLVTVSSDELERFFDEDLSKNDRQRLMNLPRDQMRDELRHLYLERTGRPDRPDGPPMGPPGGRRTDGPQGDRPPFGPRDGSGFPRRPPGERMERPDGERREGPGGRPGEFRGQRRPGYNREGFERDRPPGPTESPVRENPAGPLPGNSTTDGPKVSPE